MSNSNRSVFSMLALRKLNVITYDQVLNRARLLGASIILPMWITRGHSDEAPSRDAGESNANERLERTVESTAAQLRVVGPLSVSVRRAIMD